MRILLAAVFVASIGGGASAAAPEGAVRPSIEGKWLAPHVGSADDYSAVGLEIRPNERGELIAHSYVEILNIFGIALGVVDSTGEGTFTVRGEGIDLKLEGSDTLYVTGLVSETVVMKRSETLPAQPPAPNPPAGPGPRWSVRLGGAVFAPAAVRGGVAYVGTTDGVFFALKVSDGTVVWKFPAGRAIYSEALVTEDAVFFGCDNGWLFRLERASGKEVWRYDLGDARVARIPPNPFVFDYDEHGATPVLADGILYMGAGDGGFHAIKADSGERLWRIQSKGKIRATAAVSGANVIFNSMGGWLSAVGRATGTEKWSLKLESPFTSEPAILDGIVIVGNRDSRLRGLDAATGTTVWFRRYWGSWVESSAVFRDGHGYIGSGDLFVVSCFDPKTGANLWRTNVNGWVLQRPAVTEKLVFASVSGGRRRKAGLVHQSTALTALDRATGRILWSWPMPEWPGAFLGGFVAAPTLADDTVLVGGVDGTLYAFPAQEKP